MHISASRKHYNEETGNSLGEISIVKGDRHSQGT